MGERQFVIALASLNYVAIFKSVYLALNHFQCGYPS
jgi:hypothetical protein